MDKNYQVKKIQICGTATNTDILKVARVTHGLHGGVNDLVLLTNQNIDLKSSFTTLQSYVREHHVNGATRLYIGIEPRATSISSEPHSIAVPSVNPCTLSLKVDTTTARKTVLTDSVTRKAIVDDPQSSKGSNVAPNSIPSTLPTKVDTTAAAQNTVPTSSVNLEDVLEEIVQMRCERNEPSDSSHPPLCDTDKYTPYGEDVQVLLFMHKKKLKFKRVYTKWGPFLLIPNELLDEFDNTREHLQFCWKKDKALVYFLKNIDSDAAVQEIAPDVIEMDEQAFNKFLCWRDRLID